MLLRLLVPLTLIWPVLAVAVEGTPLRRYRATPVRELLATLFCVLSYLALWIVADKLIESVSGTAVAGIVGASVLSLVSVPLLLFLSFRLLGVRPAGRGSERE